MVNEINKPSKENAALSERLAASNRQLREMQEEHRQLVLEMETLRHRATELSRLNALPIERPPQPPAPVINPVAIENVTQEEEAPTNNSSISPESTEETISHQQEEKATVNTDEVQNPLETIPKTVENQPPSTPPTPVSVDNSNEANASDEKVAAEEDEAGTAAYLQEKLAEIARLKSQFKRVQNLIDTTNTIEQHIASKDTTKAELVVSKAALESAVTAVDAAPVTAPLNSSNTSSDIGNNVETNVTQSSGESSAVAAENDENRELLDTMYNLFTDFTADLRGQADNLRAERDRIKTLRDEILSRRQQK